jgi:hypothetical protein
MDLAGGGYISPGEQPPVGLFGVGWGRYVPIPGRARDCDSPGIAASWNPYWKARNPETVLCVFGPVGPDSRGRDCMAVVALPLS